MKPCAKMCTLNTSSLRGPEAYWKENKKRCKGCLCKCANVILHNHNPYSNPHIQTYFTMCFLQSEPPSNGAHCQCRRFPSRRSCCGWWIGPDCGSFWPTSRLSPPSGCRGTPSAFGEPTLGPTWTADLWGQCVVFRNAANDWCRAEQHLLLVLSLAVSLLRFPAWFIAFTMKMYLVPHWRPCTV